MTTGTLIVVAMAGGLGAVLRFILDGAVANHNRWQVPLGTVIINVTGSFMLGLLTGLALSIPSLIALKLPIGTGLIGGYTTFSTASVEGVRLALRDGFRYGHRQMAFAAAHSAGMLLLSVAAALLGLWLA